MLLMSLLLMSMKTVLLIKPPKIPQLQKVPMTDKQLKQNEVKLWTVTFDSFLEKQSR